MFTKKTVYTSFISFIILICAYLVWQLIKLIKQFRNPEPFSPTQNYQNQANYINYINYIHLVYFPWNKADQKWKKDPYDFDQTYFHELQKRYPDMKVKLWTKPETEKFVRTHYPHVWKTLEKHASRPVQYIDVIRVLLVYHFGGLSIQYGGSLHSEIHDYFASGKQTALLFTEYVWNENDHREVSKRLRKGVPEEQIRVLLGMFSASISKHPYFLKVLERQCNNLEQYDVQEDYDILFISGNACFSTCYAEFGHNDPSVQLVDLQRTWQLVSFVSSGSWRTDKPDSKK